MAELPRYQSGNIQYADLPRISTAALEEQASGARFMSEKIGQLTSFAFKKAGEQAVEEAKKFAAENPVTQAQIDAAKQDKNVVEKFLGAFTGKGGVMYQNALSEAQGILLSNNLQVEATKTFNDLLKKAELGQIGFEDARLEINDMVDGYMASVTAFNPDAAYQMKAALATRGNSVLTKVGDFETNRIQAALKSDFLTNMSDGEVDLTSLYASQATSIVLDSGQQLSRADAAQLILNPLQNTAIGLGDEKMIGDIVQMNRKP